MADSLAVTELHVASQRRLNTPAKIDVLADADGVHVGDRVPAGRSVGAGELKEDEARHARDERPRRDPLEDVCVDLDERERSRVTDVASGEDLEAMNYAETASWRYWMCSPKRTAGRAATGVQAWRLLPVIALTGRAQRTSSSRIYASPDRRRQICR